MVKNLGQGLAPHALTSLRRVRERLLLYRLLKKVQMQGGERKAE
jgi:hypothetical protein